MSLTRTEWVEMWKILKEIEHHSKTLGEIKRAIIMNRVKRIKDMVESVIGQME